jgi:hypothetical protein
MNEKSETLCGICNVRKIQGTGTTCFSSACRGKGIRARISKKCQELQGQDNQSHCDKKVKLNKVEVPNTCVYCKNRNVINGKVVCFHYNCIRQHKPIKPKNATRFLVHILLSMGQFETEFELLSEANMRAAFTKCSLFTNSVIREEQHESFLGLLKKYITEELAFYPVSTRSFDYYLVQAKQIFYDVLLEENMPTYQLAPVLFTSIRAEWTETIQKEIARRKEIHVDVCLKELHHLPGLPTKNELMNLVSKDNPHSWNAQFDRDTATQTIESYEEQKAVIDTIKTAIQKYAHGNLGFTKSIIINGPPGAGKTFLMMIASLLALCKGLTATPTALMAERASTLGGTYIHRLF